MAKLTTKIALPIILAGIFAIAVFIGINYSRLEPSFYIVILFLVIFVFFFGLATGRNLALPIRELLKRAEDLNRGDLSSRINLETKDELAELAKAFNKIAEELEASRLQEENTEKSVNIKVKARTQELEEIINSLDQKVKNRTIELERITKELEKLNEMVKNKK